MRYSWLVLAGSLLSGTLSQAQQPPAQPYVPQPPAQPAQAAPPPQVGAASPRLDQLLQRWEQEMKGVQTLVTQCTRTELNNVNMTTEVFVGTAKYMRPNRALLEMQKKTNAQIYEKYICNGNSLYEYRPQTKQLRIHDLPQGAADDGFLSFLFGMKAEEAKRRYDLKLVKEDQWWIYLEIIPRLPADKADFQKARLVLSASTFLPRELWFQQPNGNEVKWDMPQLQANVQLNEKDFTPPSPPTDWNVQRVPRAEAAPRTDMPPRVVRPAQPTR